MVSLAVVDEPEESFEEAMDTPESQFHLDKNFGKEFIIPDNYSSLPNNSKTCSEAFDGLDSLSEEIEYVSIKEEAYVTTYKSTVLQGTPGVHPTDIDLYDSGASCHMSGFCHCFIKLVKIIPKSITVRATGS